MERITTFPLGLLRFSVDKRYWGRVNYRNIARGVFPNFFFNKMRNHNAPCNGGDMHILHKVSFNHDRRSISS